MFTLGEHHSHKFAVASPAVVLAAIAGGRTLAEGDVLTRAGEITREFYDVMRASLGGYEE